MFVGLKDFIMEKESLGKLYSVGSAFQPAKHTLCFQ